MAQTTVEDEETGREAYPEIQSLFPEGELDENQLKERAKTVRRTMRKANHFSRQERPLKRARQFALRSVEQLRSLASFQRGLNEGDWSDFARAGEAIRESLDPFLSFYGSHGKLPDITLGKALGFVLYEGVVEGTLDLGTDLEISRDTHRGSYP